MNKLKIYARKSHLTSSIFYLTISLVCLIISFTLLHFNTTKIIITKSPEINYLSSKQLDFNQLKTYFQKLSEEKGAVYAFKVLNQIPVPYGTDMHLLAHAVGDELYKQKGIEGMAYCTDDFRNACSHSMVINLFYEKGEAGINEVKEACKEAPGKGGYSMCYHGLGHGVFAYAGYDFSKTDPLCKKIADNNLSGAEYRECMGGAVMEQISGGDHEKSTWEKMRELNMKKDDPLYLCMSNLITNPDAKDICLIYLTPYLWDMAGRNSIDLPDNLLAKSFEYCNEIPKTQMRYRDACFGGFGKEFLAMAKGKDIRHIDQLNDDEMKQIYHWCLLTPEKDGQTSCIKYAEGSMYWSGANDKKLPEQFCKLGPTEDLQNSCFEGLIGIIKKGDLNKPDYFKEFCSEIPDSLQEKCRSELSI